MSGHRNLSSPSFFIQLSSFYRYLTKSADHLEIFKKIILQMCLEKMENLVCQERIFNLLFTIFFETFPQTTKSVKFDDEELTISEKEANYQEINEEFYEFLVNLTKASLQKCQNYDLNDELVIFNSKLLSFHNGKTLSNLFDTDSLYVKRFYDLYLDNWIKQQETRAICSTRTLKAIIYIVQKLCSVTNEKSEKILLLDRVCKSRDPILFSEMLIRLNNTEDKDCKNWLRSEIVSNTVMSFADELTRSFSKTSNVDDIKSIWRIIHYCLESDNFSREQKEHVIKTFENNLKSLNSEDVMTVIGEITTHLFCNPKLCSLPSFKQFLIFLFSMNCNLSRMSDDLFALWQNGFETVLKSNGVLLCDDSLLTVAATILKQKLQKIKNLER